MSDKINNFKITTASNNFNQKEKIIKYLCDIPSIPEIDKYIFK